MIGQIRKFELWQAERWNKRLATLLDKVGTITSDPQSVVSSLVL